MNIAIFTPNKNPYSETFIQAHKNYLKGNIFYYYGGINHLSLEGSQDLLLKKTRFKLKIWRKLKRETDTCLRHQLIVASLKEHQIDVVLIEYGTQAFALNEVLTMSGLPVLVHFHGYDASVRKTIKACDYYKSVFLSASKIIVVSQYMAQQLLKMGCPNDKLLYNVYGPQPEFEHVVPTFKKQQFVAIGRFTDKKAPYYTILAFKQIVENYPDARLVFAGDGPLINVCKALVSYYNLDNKVQFLGVIQPEVYRALLAESLAFVQHSIIAADGDMEGTPLAVLEASIAGLPVISTYHAGIPDVIIDGETGLLSHEHDVDTMAAHMLKVLEHPDFAKQMGLAGKVHIKTNFSLERHIDVLQNALKKAVKT